MGNNLPKPPHGLMGALNEKLLIEQNWFRALLVVLVLLIVGLLYRYYKSRKRHDSVSAEEESIVDKIAHSARELDSLQGLDFISGLDKSLRLFIGYKSGEDVSGRTYEEILNSSLLNQFSGDNSEKIRSFYELCERTKYASQSLSEDDINQHGQFIKSLLDSVEVDEDKK